MLIINVNKNINVNILWQLLEAIINVYYRNINDYKIIMF